MTSTTIPDTQTDTFHADQVLPIAGAHFVHDTYTAFVPTFLPVIIEKLSLSLTAGGSLTAIMQLPAILNPFIGYMADKVSLRYFVILAPAVTASLVGLIGLAPNFFTLALIFFAIGVSVAAFHAPAPAIIGRIAGSRIGMGMSLYMAAGELARAAGPPIAAWAIATWTLEGSYRTVFIGWAISFILYLRLRHISAQTQKPGSLRTALPLVLSLFVPIGAFYLVRNPLNVCLSTFLPTFMSGEGASLLWASLALSILEFAGVGGALLSGTLSDRIGRKPILLAATVLASALTLLLLRVDGFWMVPVLLALGFTSLSPTPVLLAIVQEHLPNNRAVGNGLLMVSSFLIRALAMFLVGVFGDMIGLRETIFWCALISLLAIPAILAIPVHSSQSEAG